LDITLVDVLNHQKITITFEYLRKKL